MEKKPLIVKWLVLVVIFLFFGVSNIECTCGKIAINNVDENSFIQNDEYEQSFQDLVPGEFVIKFKENVRLNPIIINNTVNTGVTSIDKLNKEFSVSFAEKIFKDDANPLLSNIYKFAINNDVSVLDFLNEYSSDISVVYVEPIYMYHTYDFKKITKTNNQNLGLLDTFPNDPLFSQQWALSNIKAPGAWDTEKGDSSVTIAIVDTGVDIDHIDLSENVWSNAGEIPNNGIDDDHNGFIDDVHGWDFVNGDDDPSDDVGHGTHCAGIVSSVTNNSLGVAGVCWNCKIMPVKCFNDLGGKQDDISRGIIYAADNGADIISMSWGGYFSNLIRDALYYSYGSGIALIAAAGNDNSSAENYPADYENIMAVGATDNNDERAIFSNFGSWVDVAAPGVDVLSLRAEGTDLYGDGTHIVDKFYYIASGTSMSCPHVAGLAALLLSKNNQCPYPAQMIQSMIPYTADKIITDEYIGSGRINASKALQQEAFAAKLDFIQNWEDVKETMDIQGAAWGENFQYFTIEYGVGEHPDDWTKILTSYTPQGGVLTSIDTNSLNEGLYSIRLTVVCDHGNYTDQIPAFINNQADGSYTADIFVSNCYDSNTPGWGVNHFATIQDGINNSKRGNTVFVYDGIYPELIILSAKSISLIAQNKSWTIIEGYMFIGFCFDLIISGFTIRPGESPFIDVSIVLSLRCTVSDNNLLNPTPLQDIFIFFSSHCNIKGNRISGLLHSKGINTRRVSYLNISSNTIKNHYAGIFLEKSNSNIIYNNTITKCEKGIYFLTKGKRNLIYKNNINHADVGLFFGIRFSSNYVIANNLIDNNYGFYAIEIMGELNINNHFYYNNFINNGNAFDVGVDMWYKLEGLMKGKGNYWSDYTGTDSNGDGIGDTPYIIPGKDNKDLYPFVEPVGNSNVKNIEQSISEIVKSSSKEINQLYYIIILKVNSLLNKQINQQINKLLQNIMLR